MSNHGVFLYNEPDLFGGENQEQQLNNNYYEEGEDFLSVHFDGDE